ncbi:hypothetical protein [Paraburkholderia kururiensis]|uniref:hypothetical protein n=1 Tax=Paraburkholderia kururiensis TaxID=984307 RepID=UPI001267FEBD|nr:hypothetical protein [Paraburkholderia kururiensis]
MKAFEDVKSTLSNALNLADPERALQEAEHAFMHALAAAHTKMSEDVAALVKRIEALESPGKAPAAASSDVAVKAEAESLIGKVEAFVEHIIHPDANPAPEAQSPAADAAPSGTEPPAA